MMQGKLNALFVNKSEREDKSTIFHDLCDLSQSRSLGDLFQEILDKGSGERSGSKSRKSGRNSGKIYRCTLCDYITGRECKLKSHQDTVHKVIKKFDYSRWTYTAEFRTNKRVCKKAKNLKCKLCEYIADYKYQLEKHITDIHGKNSKFSCDQCEFKTGYKKYLMQHRKGVHERTKVFTCSICSHKTLTKEKLNEHNDQVHNGKKLFDFTHFKSEKVDKSEDRKKIIVPANNTVNKCSICEFSSPFEVSLINHMKSKHEENKHYNCESCGFKTANKANLSTHIMLCHDTVTQNGKTAYNRKVQKPIQNIPNKIKNLGCNLCSYKSSSEGRLNSHMRRVHDIGHDIRCTICDYKTNYEKDMKNHFDEKHKNIKKYVCIELSYKEADPTTPQIVESDSRVFDSLLNSCNICNSNAVDFCSTNQQNNADYKKVERFSCNKCDYKTITNIALKFHKKSRHSIRSDFWCLLCDFKTSRNYLMHRHSQKCSRFRCENVKRI